MSIALEPLSHKVQRTAVGTMVDVALAHVRKDRQKVFAEMVDVAKQFYGDSFSEETYEHARAVLTDADSKWSKLINCVLDQTAPNVARTTALNLGYEAFFRGDKDHPREPHKVPLQYPVADPVRPHFGLQYALRGMLGGRVRPQKQPQL